MKKNIIISTLFISTAITAFAELQNIGSDMIADPELTENANVNVVLNNADYSSQPLNIIMGSARESPLPLSSVTSQISNINAVFSNLIGGSFIGSISGDVKTEVSNSNMSSGNVVGASLGYDGNNIGGSTYLTINNGTYHSVAGGYFLIGMPLNDISIGGSSNVVVNGGTVKFLYGGSMGKSEGENIKIGNVNVLVNASDSSNTISIGTIYGLYGKFNEQTNKLNITFAGNGENLNIRETVSAIGNYSGEVSTTERVISFGSGENAFVGQFNGKISNVKIGDQNQFNELVIGKNSSVEFTENFELSVDTLSIFSDSEVSGGAKITVDDALNIYISDSISASDLVLDLGESIVLSAESQANISILHEDGSLFDGAEFAYDPETNSFAISNVPEPSTYAAIFGALALAFAAYRRRK